MSDEQRMEPMASVRGDVRRVRESSAATADELKVFLGELRGKSPQEMLGLIAQSSLFQCCITATLIFVVIVAVCTAAPFGWSKVTAGKAAAATQEEVPAKPEAKPEPKPTPESTQPAATPEPEVKPEKDDLIDALGIGDAINSPLDSNPLESKGDDLFNDLK